MDTSLTCLFVAVVVVVVTVGRRRVVAFLVPELPRGRSNQRRCCVFIHMVIYNMRCYVVVCTAVVLVVVCVVVHVVMYVVVYVVCDVVVRTGLQELG